MNDTTILALDGMGGEHAPYSVIQGAEIVSIRRPNVYFNIYGDKNILQPIIDDTPNLKDRCTVIHSTERVMDHDKPSYIVRNAKGTSMDDAIQAVNNGDAHAVISSGNTGGLLALAMFAFKRMENVSKPAICGFFPTSNGESCMLDLGGNITATAQELVNFAHMGTAFAQIAFGIKTPSVALLNIGTEDIKGHEDLKEANNSLRDISNINYHGFIEADRILHGNIKVFVTDGFTGNMILKASEGTSKYIGNLIKNVYKESWLTKIGYLLTAGALKRFKDAIDPRYYNGAIILGLNQLAIKSHGSADKVAFANAIEIAVDLVEENVLEQLKVRFEQ